MGCIFLFEKDLVLLDFGNLGNLNVEKVYNMTIFGTAFNTIKGSFDKFSQVTSPIQKTHFSHRRF